MGGQRTVSSAAAAWSDRTKFSTAGCRQGRTDRQSPIHVDQHSVRWHGGWQSIRIFYASTSCKDLRQLVEGRLGGDSLEVTLAERGAVMG